MNYPTSIKNLIECYKKLPGIGEKTAERLALSTMKMDDNMVNLFSTSIVDVKNKIRRCDKCNNYSEDELCELCKDHTREQKTICVVEEPKNIILFEKTGAYKGMYHVLNGLISPLDGINPEDINIDSLIKRIEVEDINEIIIAVKPSIEGETTALYLSKKLEGMNVKITKIAHGIPLGAEMDYVDALTLEVALENRTQVS